MKKNIGSKDRFIRLILSVIAFALAVWLESWVFAAIGVFTLFEAFFSWCILYQILGKSSCKCALLLVSILFVNTTLSAWWGNEYAYEEYYDPYNQMYDEMYVDDGYYFTLNDGTRWVTYDPMGYDYYGQNYYANDYYFDDYGYSLEPMSSYDAYSYQYPNYGQQYQPYWMTVGGDSFVVYYVP